MIVGFTGTREGCTADQTLILMRRMDAIAEAHPSGDLILLHGACIGADETAACHGWGLGYLVTALPCTLRNMQSAESLRCSDVVRGEQAPMVRNRAIVTECDLLIACPSHMTEFERSGTWATVRYARKAGKPVTIIWPDGSVTEEPATGVPA